jgi:hypothetical protein
MEVVSNIRKKTVSEWPRTTRFGSRTVGPSLKSAQRTVTVQSTTLRIDSVRPI